MIALLVEQGDRIGADILHLLPSCIVHEDCLVRLGTQGQIVKRLVLLLDRREVQVARLLIQIARNDRCIRVRHHEFRTASLPIDLACIRLNQRLAHDLVVVHLQHAPLVSVLKRTLEVFCYLLLPELLLNSVDDGHDPLDVAIKDVTLLQTLERDLTLLSALLPVCPVVVGED